MDTRSEKPLVFWLKTENQTLKKRKTANRNRHQNRKTEVFRCKNRKTDLKNGRNRKTENPNAPLCKQCIFLYSCIVIAIKGSFFVYRKTKKKVLIPAIFASKDEQTALPIIQLSGKYWASSMISS